ncbi:MAG: molybdenum cofactor guanylyltransferase [Edaphobacter sp.]|uniref:molybdenum cofactor guanylyltransferase n=1 Tax=Edaphobacter sp. TaxID=1934404 RepID=UPI00239AC895|nr:molybdenum cofactor guanylyltransferase [Edaphobacter sp.]MDE1175289.1 molybdenum cofactor guanylyltransferase [Edaphobacter sp.]
MAESRVTGFVLAGGKSSRMGRDKALLEAGGRPLAAWAAAKLSAVTERVCILSDTAELARYGELVVDLRAGCGPLGGVEAALQAMTTDWGLFLAVDMPLVPTGLLRWLIESTLRREQAAVALFEAEGFPQPALCLLHRSVAPYITAALDQSLMRLYPALREAGRDLAEMRGAATGDVLLLLDGGGAELESQVTERQWEMRRLWFANVNTPQDFAAMEETTELLAP